MWKYPNFRGKFLFFFWKICWKHDTLLQLLGIHYSSAFCSTLGFSDLTECHFSSYILVPFPDSSNFSSCVQFSCIMVRLSQGTFFAVGGDSFQWKMNLCSILCRSVSSTFSLLSVLRDYVKIWFQGKLVVRWLVQKQPFLPFLTQPKSSNNYFLEKHLSLERQKWYYYQFCDFRHF